MGTNRRSFRNYVSREQSYYGSQRRASNNMKNHPQEPHHTERQEWIAEIEKKQRNLTWPDAMRNSRGVDALFFKGNPDAPMVQRIGCWIFGCSMFFVTATSIEEFLELRIGFFIVFAIGSALFGGWVFSRGFVGLRQKQHGTPDAESSENP